MAVIVLFNDGDHRSVHVSNRPAAKLAKDLCDHFDGYYDNTVAKRHTGLQEGLDGLVRTVVTTDNDVEPAVECDAAIILTFTTRNLAWALAEADCDPALGDDTLKLLEETPSNQPTS